MKPSLQILPQGGDLPDVETTLEAATATALRMLDALYRLMWTFPTDGNLERALRYQAELCELNEHVAVLHEALEATDIPGLLAYDVEYFLSDDGKIYPRIEHAIPVCLRDAYLYNVSPVFHPGSDLSAMSEKALSIASKETEENMIIPASDLRKNSAFVTKSLPGAASPKYNLYKAESWGLFRTGWDGMARHEIESAICTEAAQAKRALRQVRASRVVEATPAAEAGPSRESFETVQGDERITVREVVALYEKMREAEGLGPVKEPRKTVQRWIERGKLVGNENGLFRNNEAVEQCRESIAIAQKRAQKDEEEDENFHVAERNLHSTSGNKRGTGCSRTP